MDSFGIAVAVFIIITLVVGVFASKLVKNSGKRLIVAGKSLPLFMVGTMLAAQAVDGNSSLGNVALVFEFGFWAGAVIPIGLGLCLFMVAAFYAKPLNKMSMITLPDFYFRRFGNGAEGLSGILMIISFLILVAGNLAASGFILEVVFGIDYFYGIAISAIVVVIYTIAGGLFASAYTNLFQVYLAIGAFWAGFLFFYGGFADTPWDVIYNNAPPEFMDLSGLYDVANGALINWGAILALGLGDIVALDFMERVFSAKNPKTAQRGALMGGALTMFTVIPTSMLGIVAFFYLPIDIDPNMALPLLSTEILPFAIGAAILMGVIGASMSTASGGLLAISSVISRNMMQRIIRRRWQQKPNWSDSQLLKVTRIAIIPMMIVGLAIGYFIPAPGIYLILAFDIVFAGAFAPLTFGLFWKKANMPAAVVSLVAGSLIRLAFFFIMPEDITEFPQAGLDTMIPPIIAFALFIIVALATQNKYPGKARHDVRDYVPPEEDVISGEDLKHFKEDTTATSAGGPDSSTPGPNEDIPSKNTT
ncbi:sodium:solute symporter family protein [Marine Group I thaumarchaeote]|nr:sodium:solute symporter family protein [Marine Group I thaumarchaeote]NWJ56860.1 sodium:solute symporter family protein [Marine Group I thaumarchaeote]NWJ83863.1 sodium:solute symporter family protein [Marine Group I thaumarchaeote]NWK08424.1 sodium:solute symporter family protein [Marine Group I thaumarchaeote]NWK13306.1 sodium:solute symporter family protein [Marine Group I thaumarchaeote]